MQTVSYQTLVEVIENHTLVTLNNDTETMTGFRLPSYMAEINVKRYHYSLSPTTNFGGHVMECIVRNAVIAIDYAYDYGLTHQKKT